MSQRPAAIGLLVCEQVIIEESTRSITPVNCFMRRTVRQIPPEPLSFVVFGTLNDGSGEIRLDLAIERLDFLEEIYRRSITYRFADQMAEVSCIFRVRDFSFPVSALIRYCCSQTAS